MKSLQKECSPVAYIPAGSLEWHGVQNPLGTDGLKAHTICCEAALRYGGVVLPPFFSVFSVTVVVGDLKGGVGSPSQRALSTNMLVDSTPFPSHLI